MYLVVCDRYGLLPASCLVVAMTDVFAMMRTKSTQIEKYCELWFVDISPGSCIIEVDQDFFLHDSIQKSVFANSHPKMSRFSYQCFTVYTMIMRIWHHYLYWFQKFECYMTFTNFQKFHHFFVINYLISHLWCNIVCKSSWL